MVASRRRRFTLIGLGLMLLGTAVFVLRSVCVGAWISYGISVDECPDGRPRQTVRLTGQNLRRGGAASIMVGATASYETRHGGSQTAEVRRFEPAVFLVDGSGKETALAPKDGWRELPGTLKLASVQLPEVPDGDYLLRAKVRSPLGDDTVDVPLGLYAPARVHVLTDRPLYQPGDTVHFRAVVLRAKDLTPLDGRPGVWEVRDPSGDVVLQEKAPAGSWGVVAGSFPLDRGAPQGSWKVRWSSGDASDELSLRVEPFTLPRFHVEADPSKPFYRPGDVPSVKGRVLYASGAPVANAALELSWHSSGEWPPPTDWLTSALPRKAVTGADGQFELTLPKVPADLRKQVTLSAGISARDPAGDRVEGNVALLLSEDAIQVSAVTELAEGLAEGFNNRVYLRATTADGQVLPGATLHVQRAWDPRDPGVDAQADEDGVASLQLDPGPAVNVVIPPMPFRPPPRIPAVTRADTSEILGGDEPRLADQTAMDGWLPAFEPCAKWTEGDARVVLAFKVGAAGDVQASAAGDGSGNNESGHARLEACALDVLRGKRLPPGPDRVYSLALEFSDRALPKIAAAPQSVLDLTSEVTQALGEAVLAARDCVPESATGGTLPRALVWHARKGSKEVELSWASLGGEMTDKALAPVAACAQGRIASKLTVKDPLPADDVGVAHLQVAPSPRMQSTKPQAQTLLGYELKVTARVEGQELGSTKLVLNPGMVPPVRLRASSVLAQAGDTVDVELLRGPGFSGTLPEKLKLVFGHEKLEAVLDPKTRVARFTLPPEAEGWGEVEWGGSRTILYARPKARLSVEVAPDRQRYAPGELARLDVRTSVGGKGGPAAVGLFGVDESLSQLAPLPGPGDLSRVRPKVAVSAPAFGSMDGEALALGRVRGKNAAAATVLRVTSLPAAEELDRTVAVAGASTFDAEGELTDRFFTVLQELYAQARSWEEQAPKGEQASPKVVASLWEKALDACEKRGEKVTDAYGRRLKLSRLPEPLLSQTDPRAVVADKTRLPEDVENWQAWVAKEEP